MFIRSILRDVVSDKRLDVTSVISSAVPLICSAERLDC